LGAGDLAIGSNLLVVSGAVGAGEQLDVSSVVSCDSGGLGVLDAEALSERVNDAEIVLERAIIVVDMDTFEGKCAGAECQKDQECLLHG